MFEDSTIKNRVMAVINEKIKAKQKEHDDGVVELEKKLEEDKLALADRLVDEILSKII